MRPKAVRALDVELDECRGRLAWNSSFEETVGARHRNLVPARSVNRPPERDATNAVGILSSDGHSHGLTGIWHSGRVAEIAVSGAGIGEVTRIARAGSAIQRRNCERGNLGRAVE